MGHMPEDKKKVCFDNKGRSTQEIEDKKRGNSEKLWCPILFVLTHKTKQDKYLHLWQEDSLVVTGPDRVCSGSTLDCLCFPESTVGSMHRECLNICSGNDLLWRIPHGSTYISVAAAGGKHCRQSLPDLMC